MYGDTYVRLYVYQYTSISVLSSFLLRLLYGVPRRQLSSLYNGGWLRIFCATVTCACSLSGVRSPSL
jgi:hypothetical protein